MTVVVVVMSLLLCRFREQIDLLISHSKTIRKSLVGISNKGGREKVIRAFLYLTFELCAAVEMGGWFNVTDCWGMIRTDSLTFHNVRQGGGGGGVEKEQQCQ